MAERKLAVVEEATAIANTDMFSDKRVEMIRNTVAKGAPDDTFVAFLDIAKRRNLDPLAKQISLIKFGGQYTIITTIDGYRAIAEQTGQYGGSDAPVFTYAGATTKAGKKAPDTATVTVYKLINGNPYPFSATVYFEEYSTNQNNWSTMPRTMLAKVAESHALRKAFPAVMSGMYEESEMDQAIEGTARVVESTPRQVTADVDPEKAMRRLHAIAANHDISHDDLKLWAADRGKKSTKDFSAQSLHDMATSIDSEPEKAAGYFAKLRNDAELKAVGDQISAQLDGEVVDEDGVIQGNLVEAEYAHPNHGDS